MPVNLSANKVQWGMIETLFLSLILNPAWLINQTKCSGCETERSSVKVTVIRCPSYRAGSRWAAVHVYLLHTAASCVCKWVCVCVCITVCVYVIKDVCVCFRAGFAEHINDRWDDEWDRKCCFHFGTHNSIRLPSRPSVTAVRPTLRHSSPHTRP